MARPTNIRVTIEACRASLEEFGSLHVANAVILAGKGAQRTVPAFYLNEEQALYVTMHCRTERAEAVKATSKHVYYLNRQQALLVCILSKTEKAKAVRAEVIRRFDAYEEFGGRLMSSPENISEAQNRTPHVLFVVVLAKCRAPRDRFKSISCTAAWLRLRKTISLACSYPPLEIYALTDLTNLDWGVTTPTYPYLLNTAYLT